MKRARIEGRGAPIERDPEEDDGQQPEEATRNDEKSNKRNRFDKVHEAAGDTLDSRNDINLPSSTSDGSGVSASSVPARSVQPPGAHITANPQTWPAGIKAAQIKSILAPSTFPDEFYSFCERSFADRCARDLRHRLMGGAVHSQGYAEPPEGRSAPTAISTDSSGTPRVTLDPQQRADETKELFDARASKMKSSGPKSVEPLWAVLLRDAPPSRLLRIPPEPRNPTLLGAGFRFNQGTLLRRVRMAVEGVAGYHGVTLGETSHLVPLPVAVGVAGQGKSGLLRLIRDNLRIQGRGAAKVTESDPSKDVPMDHCHAPTMDPGLPQNAATRWLEDIRLTYNRALSKLGRGAAPLSVERAVTVLVKYGQGGTRWHSLEDSVYGFSARLIADYCKCFFYKAYAECKYQDAVDAIRAEEAQVHGLDPKRILIVVLVDEIKVISEPGKRKKLLEALRWVQQAQLAASLPFFTLLTSPDLSSIYDCTSPPLFHIPLQSVSATDQLTFREECEKKLSRLQCEKAKLTDAQRYSLRLDICGAAGHYGTLQQIRTHLTGHNPTVIHYPCGQRYLPHLLEVLSSTILDSKLWMDEGTELGGKYLRKQGDIFEAKKTVSEVAAQNCGLIFADLESNGPIVKPKVLPCSLRRNVFRLDVYGNMHPSLKGIVLNLQRLFDTMFVPYTEKLTKFWKSMIPLLEVLTAALIRPHLGSCSFSRIYPEDRWKFFPWGDERLSSIVLSEAVEQCVMRKVLKWPGGASEKQAAALRKLLISDPSKGVYRTFPDAPGYQPIDGVCNHCEVMSSPGESVRKSVQMVIQTKVVKDATDLHTIVEAVHQYAQSVLWLEHQEYYCVLYCSQRHEDLWKMIDQMQALHPPLEEGMQWKFPGTIIVSEEALAHLLEPFGISPLLDFLKEKVGEG